MRIRFFGISLLAHAVFFAILMVKTKPPTTMIPVELEMQALQGAVATELQTKPQASVAMAKRPRASAPIDFGLSSRPKAEERMRAATQQTNQDENFEGANLKPDWRQKTAYGGSAFSRYAGMERKKIRFIQNLWREIDQSIWESSYLSEYGHFGNVFFSFDIDPQGRLLEDSFQAQVDDRILKVIAIRAIRQALKNERREIEFPTETVRIHTMFSWADYQTCALQKGTRQNYLQFCKYGENKRKSFSANEKTATYLGALRYGFGAIEEIQKYQREENRRNTGFDPFESIRRDPDWFLGG